MIVASHLRALQIVGSIFSPKARSRGHAAEVDLAPTAPGSLQDYAEFPSAYLGSLMVFFLRGLVGELSLARYDDRFFPCSLFPRGVRFWYLLRTFPRAPRSWGRRKKHRGRHSASTVDVGTRDYLSAQMEFEHPDSYIRKLWSLNISPP